MGGEETTVKFYAEGVHQDPHVPLPTSIWPLPLIQVIIIKSKMHLVFQAMQPSLLMQVTCIAAEAYTLLSAKLWVCIVTVCVEIQLFSCETVL